MTDDKSIEEQLEEIFDKEFRCYNCGKPTDRYITFRTILGIVNDFECVECRQERVQKQVDAGLRPASDLEPENFPERRNPA